MWVCFLGGQWERRTLRTVNSAARARALAALTMTYGTRSPMDGAVAGSRLRIFSASSTCATFVL